MHRFLWDVHYTPAPKVEPEFPISATYRNTAPQATSPWVAPDDYTVTLTVDGKTFTQPLTVAMDPRVKASAADLQEQFDLSWRLYQLRLKLAPMRICALNDNGQKMERMLMDWNNSPSPASLRDLPPKQACVRRRQKICA